jgi:hypothetical protein
MTRAARFGRSLALPPTSFANLRAIVIVIVLVLVIDLTIHLLAYRIVYKIRRGSPAARG